MVDISIRTLVSFSVPFYLLISAVWIWFANWQVVKKIQVAKSTDIFLKRIFFVKSSQHYLFNEKKQ